MKVDQGDIFGFLGPNGAGKTTTIRMLCGLISSSGGVGEVAGLDIVKDAPKIRSIIGLLPESSGFYNWMNAEEYLVHFANLYEIEPALGRRRIGNLLESVGLAHKAFAPISYYSRGMRQRLGLARALINEPQILFLDEPTLGLDPKGQQDIQKILLDLNRDKGVTIFLSSHDLSDVSVMCNSIAIINHGTLIAQGTIKELRKMVGSTDGVIISVLNTPNALMELKRMGYSHENNLASANTNKLIDVFMIGNVQESIAQVVEKIDKAHLEIYEVRRSEMTLDEIFFKLTEPGGLSNQHTAPNVSQISDHLENVR